MKYLEQCFEVVFASEEKHWYFVRKFEGRKKGYKRKTSGGS